MGILMMVFLHGYLKYVVLDLADDHSLTGFADIPSHSLSKL